MPANRKPAGSHQDRRPQRRRAAGTHLQVVDADAAGITPAPPCPAKLLKSSQEAWRSFWQSSSAAAVEVVDRALVEQWIVARDQWRRAMNAIERQPLVEGSMGQPVQNPLMAWAASRETAMRQLERQLGIGAKARADLGLTAGQARITAAQLNRMAAEKEPRGDDAIDAEEADLFEEFGEAR